MLHGLKLALSGRTDRSLLATDQGLSETDKRISILQRTFPQLQTSLEDNETTWTAVGTSIRMVSRHAQQMYPAKHPAQYLLNHLHSTGCSITPPGPDIPLCAERARVGAELRGFVERIRMARSLQNECVAALKEREYYAAKVESLKCGEEKRKKKVSERDVERRVRNEGKLEEVEDGLRCKWERLQRELGDVELGKDAVVGQVLSCFVRLQIWFFERGAGLDGMQGGLGGRRGSPTGVLDAAVGFGGEIGAGDASVGRMASAPPAESGRFGGDDMRVGRVASAPPAESGRIAVAELELGQSLYPQI